MAETAKFLFEHSFDERAAAPAAPDPMALLQEKHKAELEAAFARGHEAGLAEAAAGAEERMADAVKGLTAQIERLETARAEIEQSTANGAIRVAIAILRRLMPSFARHGALPEVEAVFAECLHRVRDEPRVVLRVSDDLLDAMQPRVDEAARRAGFHGKVVLLADGGLGASDCRIEWADGGAERHVDRLCNDVEELVRRTLHEPQATPSDAATAAAPTT